MLILPPKEQKKIISRNRTNEKKNYSRLLRNILSNQKHYPNYMINHKQSGLHHGGVHVELWCRPCRKQD